ncbi:MAG: alanine--tRNA ligase-related protein, partial [Candidatus Micrarchaeota archaeon]
MLKASEITAKYLKFFESKQHAVISSVSLIPENDPTVLFTTAGMHPLVPFLLGQPHPRGRKLANVQKCLRTDDIDEVGDGCHHTFFFMLGNWSLGDYFKKEAIEMSWEFLTSKKWLGLDPNRISITCFAGDTDAPRDEESARAWRELGIPDERIFFNPKKDNWWGPAGQTGPCGPDTEMFYDSGKPACGPDCKPGCSCGKWVEIWNDVFMEYEKKLPLFLVDGMHCLYNKEFKLNNELLSFLKSKPNKKILVVDGFADKALELVVEHGFEVFSQEGRWKKENPEFFTELMKKYSLAADDLIYFDHSKANLLGAEGAGIKTTMLFNGDTKELPQFIENNSCFYRRLKQQNVDTGMGLERTAAVMQGAPSDYETELFAPLMTWLKQNSRTQDVKSMRIIADHLRAAVFVLADDKGVAPSNVEHGYILRRLIRRAIRHAHSLGVEGRFCKKLAEIVVKIYGDEWPELKRNQAFVYSELEKEEQRFAETLERGLHEFEKIFAQAKGRLSGEHAFLLYQSYGFPLEMTVELAKE